MSKYNHDHDVPFEAFITNLGKYNEGDLVGEWVKFPTSAEELEAVFKRIGIGSTDEFGQPYEEWFITDYDMYVDGMYNILGEYENLDELNYLASKIEDMTDYEYEQFCAIIDQGDYTSSVQDLINMTENLDSFEILPDVENDYDLGYYYIEEAGIYDMSQMGNLANYIDYERFGRDVALEEGGVFTDHGYVCERDSIRELYQGLEDIPDEYKVMSATSFDTDRSFTVGEYKVDVQLNSDNDFDYTIYKNGKHLDGGILENLKGLETIPDSVFEEIKKMHDLDKQEYGHVYGYIYDENGMHGGKIEFEGSPENIANFIMYNKMHPVVITDMVDQFVVSSTIGGFLDRVAYPALREEIIKEILPLQMGDKEPIDVAKQDVERDPITELAKDLDDFAFDYDFYGYQDAVDDRTEHIESLKRDLETGNVEGLTDYLKEVIEEGDYMVPEATALLGRIEAIVPQQEVTKEADKAQDEVKEQHEQQEAENYLKNAEMMMEDDYGMIDGIINNGEKAEKPSIMAELKAAREARAERQPEHKEKHHDKKIDHDDR